MSNERIYLTELIPEVEDMSGVDEVSVGYSERGSYWSIEVTGSDASQSHDGWLSFDVIDALQELGPKNRLLHSENGRPVVEFRYEADRVRLE